MDRVINKLTLPLTPSTKSSPAPDKRPVNIDLGPHYTVNKHVHKGVSGDDDRSLRHQVFDALDNNQGLPDSVLQEFRESGIPDHLTLANIQWLEGDAALEYLLGDKLASYKGHAQQYATGPVRSLLKRYESIRAGMWCTRDGVPYAKPVNPRPDPNKLGGGIKYETAPGAVASPELPHLTTWELQAICDRFGLAIDEALQAIKQQALELGGSSEALAQSFHGQLSDGYTLPREAFWAWWQASGNPIAIVEGFKKALALLANGLPAIAVRGITQWHLKGGIELHPELARFATKGRLIYVVFDQDTKAKTIANVRIQIRKLGAVLEGRRCKVLVPTWGSSEGKGIDDVIYGTQDEAESAQLSRLDQILGDAPTLKQFKRSCQTWAAFNNIKRYNTLSFPIERETEGQYLPELPPLQPGAIHVVAATMNTGKTYRIGRDYVQSALASGYHVLVLSPLNSLGQQTAKDWQIAHIHDQGANGKDQKEFWESIRTKPGVVLCPDSIAKLPQWFWDKPLLLILDEANQVTEHICQGDTLKSRYGVVNEHLSKVAKLAIESNGAIVLSEANIPDRAVKFWQSLSGAESVRCIRHRKQGSPWDCTVFVGMASGFRAELIAKVDQGERLLFVTTSQREAKRLEKVLAVEGRKVVRIDSETNEGGAFKLFFQAPDTWLEVNQPDILILSPSAKSGVSIQGGVPVGEAYFQAVWGYFPSLATDTHMQLLGRYRPAVPRVMFCPGFIRGTADESLFTPQAIKKRLKSNCQTLSTALELASTGDQDLMELEATILEYLAESKAVSGAQKSIAHDALVDRLEASGHLVTCLQTKLHKPTSELWKQVQEGIWQDEALELSQTQIESGQDADWAYRALDSIESTREIRLIAHKVLWREEFPGVSFDEPDEVYQALCADYGAMRRGVLLQARAENLEATKAEDKEHLEALLSGKVRALHRAPKNFAKAAIIHHLGLLDLLDGKSWSNRDPRAIAIKQKALKYSREINYYLRLTINDDQTPSEICNKLLKKLGLEAEVIGRPGPRGVARDKVYALENADNAVRMRLLKASRDRLSDSVSPICNKETDSYTNQGHAPSNPQAVGDRGGGWAPGCMVRVLATGVTALIEDIRDGLATLGTVTGELIADPVPVNELAPA